MTKATKIYLAVLAVLLVWLGITVFNTNQAFRIAEETKEVAAQNAANWARFWMVIAMGLVSMAAAPGIIEYVFMRIIGMFRLGALVRVTYYEALLQPFTLIVTLGGIASVVIIGWIPFFTLSEDPKMYRDVVASLILLYTLVIMVFASGKVVDEEIDNRTMLTLMSKPISRWQVVLGKYLGVVMLVITITLVLGFGAEAASYLRYMDDMKIDFQVAGNTEQFNMLIRNNFYALFGLAAVLVLQLVQTCTLAAISVAISTRYSMALNMTVTLLLYVAANLTRYADAEQLRALHVGQPWMAIAQFISHILPYLSVFDLGARMIYGTTSINFLNEPTWTMVWSYVGVAMVYGLVYIGAALALAIAMFRTRELT